MAIRQDKVQIELTKDNQTDMLIIDVPSLLAVAEGETETITAEHEAGTLNYSTVTDTQENLAEWDSCKKVKRNAKRWEAAQLTLTRMRNCIDASFGDDMQRAIHNTDAEEVRLYLMNLDTYAVRMRRILSNLEA